MLTLERCNNQTYNGTCRTVEEIDQFMQVNIFYMVKQSNLLDKSVYKDNAQDFISEHEYFPIRKVADSVFYRNMPIPDPNFVDIMEIKLGMDTIEYSDSLLNLVASPKEKNFFNFRARREL